MRASGPGRVDRAFRFAFLFFCFTP